METRRTFLKTSAAVCIAAAVPEASSSGKQRPTLPFHPQQPENALVVWFSQTGHTGKIGRSIVKVWESEGLKVDSGDYRELDHADLTPYDLVAIGSPVHYYGYAINMKTWINKVMLKPGTPVASFVAYGGTGDNQHNTACSLLELMAEKAGVPVGMETFSTMSTFAPTWAIGSEKRVLKYRDLPNEDTYRKSGRYAKKIIERVERGESYRVDPEFSFSDWFKHKPSIWGTKLLIGKHCINHDKCIGCGTCESMCPVGAVKYEATTVDRDRCVACFGCIKKCPAQAIDMTFMGRKVSGVQDFMKKHQHQEPEESNGT